MTWRSIGLICAAPAAVILAGCGGRTRRDVAEPSGNFPVAVTTATFPASQRLSEHTDLVLTVRNVGRQTIPNLAATICNVTCAYPAPAGEGTSAAAFSENLQMPGLAHPSRPVWVVDTPPGSCHHGCGASSAGGYGGPGGAVTAYANTWALGPLAPNASATFDWGVTAVAPGHHVIAWEIAAGLHGKAKAVLADGSPPHGTFVVTIHSAPSRSYVTGNGQILTTSSSAP